MGTTIKDEVRADIKAQYNVLLQEFAKPQGFLKVLWAVSVRIVSLERRISKLEARLRRDA